MQNVLRKIKSKFSPNDYKQLYQTRSCPAKFYWTAEIQKLSQGDQTEKRPIIPIISKIDAATYRLAKQVAKFLSLSSTSEYIVKSTKDFTEKLRTLKVPKGYQMVSFHVKALLKNVPFEYTIDLVLKGIYENHEISTLITRNEMRETLLLCTKNIHFIFRDVAYLQRDGAALGSPLRPVSARIFMIDLESSLVTLLTAELSFWKRYVNGAMTFVNIGTVDHILRMLNNFHPHIRFPYETEYNSKLAFLDVMLCRDGENIVTEVYRKVTNADVYLNWNYFAPHSSKLSKQ